MSDIEMRKMLSRGIISTDMVDTSWSDIGRIYIKPKALYNFLQKQYKRYTNKMINEIWYLFSKHGFVFIEEYKYNYYLEDHPDFRKIKLFVTRAKKGNVSSLRIH